MAWQWAARGKHPVAKDYFEIGSNNPMVEAFSAWLEEGYRIFGSRKRPLTELCSWRFWAKGPNRETLICGIGRDSSDSVGRPFPLLIIGTGSLLDWRHEWDLLPAACERSWSQMEYLSSKRFGDFEQFEAEIRHMKPPSGQWSELRVNLGAGKSESSSPSDIDEFSWRKQVLGNDGRNLSDEKVLFLALDDRSFENFPGLTSRLHGLLKRCDREVPNAVFMGGTSQQTYLAVFRRALATTDFVRLWSSEGQTSEL